MQPGLLLVVALGSWILALGARTGAEVLRLRRLVRVARATIGEVGDGQRARLVGVVAAMGGGATLTAPLTGRPCVAYHAVVEDQMIDGPAPLGEQRHVGFTIADDHGAATVEPAGAELWFERAPQTWIGTLGDDPVRDRTVLAWGGRVDGWHLGKRVRFTERILAVGDRVAVIGHAIREPDPDGASRATGYRDALPTRVRLQASPGRPLIITDRGDLTGA